MPRSQGFISRSFDKCETCVTNTLIEKNISITSESSLVPCSILISTSCRQVPFSFLPKRLLVSILELHIHGIMQYVNLVLWLLLFNIMFLRFTHVLARISNLLWLNSKHYYMGRSQLICSSIKGRFSCDKLLVIMTNVGNNIPVQTFLS